MIVILSDAMTDGEIDSINTIYSTMNKEMYNISFNTLKDKIEAEEAVEKTFFQIVDNIEKISILPFPEMEAYCIMILNKETKNILRERKKAAYGEFKKGGFTYEKCEN